MTLGTHCSTIEANECIFSFSIEKNEKLIKLRGISFEEIIRAIQNDLLDIIENPNREKYFHQKMYVVELRGYVYLVPFVEDENKVFLKTAFPNREATKYYLRNRGVK